MTLRTKLAGAVAAATLLVPAAAARADHHEGMAEPEKAAAEEPHFGMDTADEYVVEPGDTLAQIAQDHFGSKDLWKHIAEANGIDDPRQLRVGQKLQIPKRKAEWLEESTP
ncbi:MAG TPA: LysM domain-containing protein [Myxococcota bacterium]|nr:LysM domain-containing protein [Myxococcota bacterium]